ncbi:unnamed protein product [Boreogadus saida]
MDEVLGQRHSTNPPVLIASIPENTPGPSTVVVDQEVEDKDQEEERQRGPSLTSDLHSLSTQRLTSDLRSLSTQRLTSDLHRLSTQRLTSDLLSLPCSLMSTSIAPPV